MGLCYMVVTPNAHTVHFLLVASHVRQLDTMSGAVGAYRLSTVLAVVPPLGEKAKSLPADGTAPRLPALWRLTYSPDDTKQQPVVIGRRQ